MLTATEPTPSPGAGRTQRETNPHSVAATDGLRPAPNYGERHHVTYTMSCVRNVGHTVYTPVRGSLHLHTKCSGPQCRSLGMVAGKGGPRGAGVGRPRFGATERAQGTIVLSRYTAKREGGRGRPERTVARQTQGPDSRFCAGARRGHSVSNVRGGWEVCTHLRSVANRF